MGEAKAKAFGRETERAQKAEAVLAGLIAMARLSDAQTVADGAALFMAHASAPMPDDVFEGAMNELTATIRMNRPKFQQLQAAAEGVARGGKLDG